MIVYKAINAVQAELAKSGISKDRNNAQQGYKFRGIDDVYNALAPILSRNGLCILPRVTSRDVVERQTKNGGALFYVTVGMEFDFVSSEDGSKHTIAMYGEAMDSGDKATNKAMSAAYKYACMQAFSIPTEGDNDADAHTHEVKAVQISPVKEAAAAMPITEQEAQYVMDVGGELVDLFNKGQEMDALQLWATITDNAIKTHLWNWLQGESKLRSFIKANRQKSAA